MSSLTRLLLRAALGAAACFPVVGHAVVIPAERSSHADCSHKNFSLYLETNFDGEFPYAHGNDCKNTVRGLYSLINETAFKELASSYNSISYTRASINFNGLPMSLQFQGNSSELLLDIPELGISGMSFGDSGSNSVGSRDASAQLLIDYLKHNKDIRKWITKWQAENTPDSPVTGANGVIPGVVSDQYASDMSNALNDTADNRASGSLLDLAASFGHTRVNGKDADVANLPLAHTWRPDLNKSQMMFNLSGSLTRVSLAGATSYQGNLGVSFRMPVTERWALTPSLRYGIANSTDLATSSGVASVGLSSTYNIPFERLDLVIGDMIGYHKTTNAIFGGNSYNPDISSWSARNGLMLSQPVNFFDTPLSLEYTLIDTRYFGGTDFFVNNTQEIGISIGTNRRGDVSKKFIRVGLRYLHGRETNSVTFSGGYWF
jgi:hypothetical protein